MNSTQGRRHLSPREQVAWRITQLATAARQLYLRGILTLGRLHLNTPPRAQPVVVNLTTVSSRLKHVTPLAITSLFHQTVRADRVILWLDAHLAAAPLPPAYRALCNAGLEVRACRDVGPHTKLVHALDAFPDYLLVTADDDRLYPPNWLATLLDSYHREPHALHAHRALLMTRDARGGLAPYDIWLRNPGPFLGPSHFLWQTGTGGVLYPPGALHPDATDSAAFTRLTPREDDVWFKAMALRHGTPVKRVSSATGNYPVILRSQHVSLWTHNRTQVDAQIRATFTAYGLYDLLARLPYPEIHQPTSLHEPHPEPTRNGHFP